MPNQSASLYYLVDGTGATTLITFAAPSTDGQLVVIKYEGGTMPNPQNINPGAGQTLENPNSQGTFLGAGVSAAITTPGAGVRYKYQLANTRFALEP